MSVKIQEKMSRYQKSSSPKQVATELIKNIIQIRNEWKK